MAEKVALLGLTREADFMYYVADAAVWKVQGTRRGFPAGTPEMVAEGDFEMDTNYIYFVDADGDIARARRAVSSRRAKRRKRPVSTPTPETSNAISATAPGVQEDGENNAWTPGLSDGGPGITHALQIMKEPIEQILAGTKTWEIRGTPTSRRGPIALIQSKTGHVVGTCELVDVVGPLSLKELQANEGRTGFRPDELYYQKTYAWVLRNARRLPIPIPFRHPHGAVIWIKLEPDVVRSVNSARG